MAETTSPPTGWDRLDAIRPADVCFQRSTSWLSRTIRGNQQHAGEPESYPSHVMMVTLVPIAAPAPLRSLRAAVEIVEAGDRGVVQGPLTHYRTSEVVALRVPDLLPGDVHDLQMAAIEYAGDPYPYVRLLQSWVDHRIFNDRPTLGRFRIQEADVCNALIEKMLRRIDRACPWDLNVGTPDDLLDIFIERGYPVVWASSGAALDGLKAAYPDRP